MWTSELRPTFVQPLLIGWTAQTACGRHPSNRPTSSNLPARPHMPAGGRECTRVHACVCRAFYVGQVGRLDRSSSGAGFSRPTFRPTFSGVGHEH